MASRSMGPRGGDAELGGIELGDAEQVFRFRASDVAVIVSKNEFAQTALAALLTKMGASQLITGRSVDQTAAQLSDRQNVVLAVLDLPLPSLEAQTIVAIRARFPAARVVVVSDSRDRDGALIALAKGAHGYVPKSLGTAEFRRALVRVDGGAIYAPALLAELETPKATLAPLVDLPDERAKLPQLTPRQRQVLELIVQGKSNKEICRALNLSEGTVKIHVSGLCRALNVKGRTAAAAMGAGFSDRQAGRAASGVAAFQLEAQF